MSQSLIWDWFHYSKCSHLKPIRSYSDALKNSSQNRVQSPAYPQKGVWWSLRRCGSLVVSVPASRLPVPGSNISPGPPSMQCGLRGGRSHCNTVQIKYWKPRPWWAIKKNLNNNILSVQVRWETIDKFPNSRLQKLRYAKTEGKQRRYLWRPWPLKTNEKSVRNSPYRLVAMKKVAIHNFTQKVTIKKNCQEIWEIYIGLALRFFYFRDFFQFSNFLSDSVRISV